MFPGIATWRLLIKNPHGGSGGKRGEQGWERETPTALGVPTYRIRRAWLGERDPDSAKRAEAKGERGWERERRAWLGEREEGMVGRESERWILFDRGTLMIASNQHPNGVFPASSRQFKGRCNHRKIADGRESIGRTLIGSGATYWFLHYRMPS